MSQLALLVPIAAVTVGPAAWAFNNWLRARHGYEPETWHTRKHRHQDVFDKRTARAIEALRN